MPGHVFDRSNVWKNVAAGTLSCMVQIVIQGSPDNNLPAPYGSDFSRMKLSEICEPVGT